MKTQTEARVSTGKHTGHAGPYTVAERLPLHLSARGKLAASYVLNNAQGYAVAIVHILDGVISHGLSAAFVDQPTFRAEALQMFHAATRAAQKETS